MWPTLRTSGALFWDLEPLPPRTGQLALLPWGPGRRKGTRAGRSWGLGVGSLSSRWVLVSLLFNRKMATNFLVHEKIWFDKFKYDDAERKFYEQMNGPVAGSSRQVGAAALGPWGS